MKVITFSSYKGGVGRTLLLAQTARFLSLLGKKVVVMDLDFDAPGLVLKFASNATATHSSKGFLDVWNIWRSIDKNNDASGVVAKEVSDILSTTRTNLGIQTKSGWVSILPVGNPKETEYWKTIQHDPSWRKFFLPECVADHRRFICDALKPAIESFEQPDYLLIDTRAGVNNCKDAFTVFLTDTLVLVFSANSENEEGVAHMFKELKGVPDQRRKLTLKLPALKVLPVLTRLPGELPESIAAHNDRTASLIAENGGAFSFSKVLSVRSDLELQVNEHVRDPHSEYDPSHITSFHEDVSNVVAALCPELTAAALWKQATGTELRVSKVHRVFTLYRNDGRMLNLEGDEPNVSLRVETFLRFLNIFTDKSLRDRAAEALLEAGEICGAAFGDDLMNNIWKSSLPPVNQRITKWCEFDSTIGFGTLKQGVKSDTIEVTGLFLYNPAITESRDHTAFFQGYIAGVLKKILGLAVQVDRAILDEANNLHTFCYSNPSSK